MPDIGSFVASVVSSFFGAFLDLFREAGQKAIQVAVEALLRTERPDFTASWFVATFASLFGLGLVLSFITAGCKAVAAAVSQKPAKMVRSMFWLPLKTYLFGSWMPYLFMVGFSMSAAFSKMIGDNFPAASSPDKSIVSIAGFGNVGQDFFFLIELILQGTLFQVEVFLVQFAMPLITILMFVFVGSLVHYEQGKIMSFFLAASITSIFAQFIMLMVLFIGQVVINSMDIATSGVTGSMTVFAWLFITVAQLIPIIMVIFLYSKVSKTHVMGAVGASREVESNTTNVKIANTHGSHSPAGSIVKSGALIASGMAIDHLGHAEREHEGSSATKTALATKGLARVAEFAAKSKSTAAGAAAGPVGATAAVLAMAVKAKAKKNAAAKKKTP